MPKGESVQHRSGLLAFVLPWSGIWAVYCSLTYGCSLTGIGPQKDQKVDGEGNVECKEIRLHIFWDIELF